MTGRPTSFTPELGESICELIAEGNSLASICDREGMPSVTTVMNWLAKSDQGDERFAGFVEHYARVCEARSLIAFEEMLTISDDPTLIDSDAIQRAKLRIDTRKWVIGRMNPKKYGDKLDITQKTTVEHATKEQRDAAVKAATES